VRFRLSTTSSLGPRWTSAGMEKSKDDMVSISFNDWAAAARP